MFLFREQKDNELSELLIQAYQLNRNELIARVQQRDQYIICIIGAIVAMLVGLFEVSTNQNSSSFVGGILIGCLVVWIALVMLTYRFFNSYHIHNLLIEHTKNIERTFSERHTTKLEKYKLELWQTFVDNTLPNHRPNSYTYTASFFIFLNFVLLLAWSYIGTMEFLEESAIPARIEIDWLEFFFEKAKLVVNEDMKLIWSKILAEEANEPGKISLSLLHALSVMRYDQAEFFCNISRFAFRSYRSNDVTLLLFVATNRASYERSRITPKKLKELERLGLIECDFNTEYVFKDSYHDITKKRFISGSHIMTVWGDPQDGGKIRAGNIQFTKDGRALYDIIDSNYKKYRNDIFEFTARKFAKRNCRVEINAREF